MSLEISNSGPAVSIEQLASVERQLGFALPKAYRTFLLSNNGGRPNPGFFPIKRDDRPFDHLQLFFTIGSENQSLDLFWNYGELRTRIPLNQLPIGCTDTGDIVCLTIGGLSDGRVMFWDHEQETSPPDYESMYHVAPTLEEFLDSFHHRDLTAEIARAEARLVRKPS